jgi:drug/metabolite transporter (DMT)-like permease
VFTNLTPVFSILAGVLFRGERLLAGQLIGAAIVLVGVWGVSKRTQKSLS